MHEMQTVQMAGLPVYPIHFLLQTLINFYNPFHVYLFTAKNVALIGEPDENICTINTATMSKLHRGYTLLARWVPRDDQQQQWLSNISTLNTTNPSYQMLNPWSLKHLRWASINSLHLSSPLSTMQASRTFFVSGQAQHIFFGFCSFNFTSSATTTLVESFEASIDIFYTIFWKMKKITEFFYECSSKSESPGWKWLTCAIVPTGSPRPPQQAHRLSINTRGVRRQCDKNTKLIDKARNIYIKEMDANEEAHGELSKQPLESSMTSIREGQATIWVPKTGTSNVFYNPVQEFNRDLSSAAVKIYVDNISLWKTKNHKEKTVESSTVSTKGAGNYKKKAFYVGIEWENRDKKN